MSAVRPPVRIILSLPRCGTHFIWSRLVASGSHQLIYDADRIPALEVLSRKCAAKLHFLWPAPSNPNYNFQYNSMVEAPGPLTAAEHLELLQKKYGTASVQEILHASMCRQQSDGRTLFSINRFVYTCANDHLRGTGSEWTPECAMEALNGLHEGYAGLDWDVRFMLVVRRLDEWVLSQSFRSGDIKVRAIERRLTSLRLLLAATRRLRIPVFLMSDVIRVMGEGRLNFETALQPVSDAEIDQMSLEAADMARQPGCMACRRPEQWFRAGRFMQYLRENDPVRRTSLVRSIGNLPVHLHRFVPVLGARIRKDLEGTVLNNARIKP